MIVFKVNCFMVAMVIIAQRWLKVIVLDGYKPRRSILLARICQISALANDFRTNDIVRHSTI